MTCKSQVEPAPERRANRGRQRAAPTRAAMHNAAPPSLGSNDADPGRVLTVWCADAPMTGALLKNAMDRVKERGRLVSEFVCGNKMLWVKLATEKQAARVVNRLHGTMVAGNTCKLQCVRTAESDWPPGMAPTGEPTVPRPQPAAWRSGRRRPGGVRHRGARQPQDRKVLVRC